MIKKSMLAALGLASPNIVNANLDGEVAWAKLAFCNGAEYCVDIVSSRGTGIDSLRMTHKGISIEIPRAMSKAVDIPLLNEVRLVSVQRSDGAYENYLEIPYLTLTDQSNHRSVLKIFIYNDEAYKAESHPTLGSGRPED